ncbi:MAG: RNA-directed DNA polymerase [Planctomycetia bacterium]|nr:RNA-directed DNA polymerase [Planctomycetia bacterium]
MSEINSFADAIDAALSNIVRHGDTDIFPFPFETHIFFDRRVETRDLLLKLHANFKEWLTKYPPAHEAALAPISYNGFRWGTQLDPFWNVYFLACVIFIAKRIEQVRISASELKIFSYRYRYESSTGDLFNKDFGWIQFARRSLDLASTSKYVVLCDISEFYPRLAHHRLENALLQLDVGGDIHTKIMDLLSNYTNTRSFGLPIGGPAARLLSELVLDQIDKLLKGEGIQFTRFADDYHLFVDSLEDAYRALIILSEKLYLNQGLTLQRSKTRILSGTEFISTSPLTVDGKTSTGAMRGSW